MGCRLFGIGALCVLLISAGGANARGGSWFGFGGPGNAEELEYEPHEMHHQPPLNPQARAAFNAQISSRLNMEKSRNTASLMVQLVQPLDHLTLTTMTNHWKTVMASLNVVIETFSPMSDKVMIRLQNGAMLNELKNFLLDDPKIALVTVEQQVFAGSAALQQQMLEFEAERMEHETEMAEEQLERELLMRKRNAYGIGAPGFAGAQQQVAQPNGQQMNGQAAGVPGTGPGYAAWPGNYEL